MSRLSCLFPILYLLASFVLANSQQIANPLSFYVTGNRSSELEPCGCHANQQGGIQYEAALYKQTQNITGLRLDAGGWVGGETLQKPFAAMKAHFLLRGMARLGFDAVNFGAGEAALSRFYYDRLRAECPEAMAPLVSANVFLTTSPRTLAFPDSRLLTRTLPGGRTMKIAVTGVATIPSTLGTKTQEEKQRKGDFLIKPIIPSLTSVVARLRPQADLLIVLVSGTAQDCIPLARACPQVDFFLASTQPAPTANKSLPPEFAGKIFTAGGPKGRQVGRLRLELSTSGKWTSNGLPEYLSVSNRLPADPEMVKLLEEYKQAIRISQTHSRLDVRAKIQ